MKRFGVLLLIAFLTVGFLAGCSAEEEPAETASLWTIEVNGEAFTQADYDAIGEVEITATKKNKDETEEEQTWKGVSLKAVLDYMGAEGYSVVTCEASDGYAKDIDDMTLVESAGTILGTNVNGEALGEEDGYIQLVMDGKGSNWWIKNLVKITTK